MREWAKNFVDSYNNYLAFLAAVITIFGALAVIIGFGWKMFTAYVEKQITKRTEFQRAVLTGIAANYNQQFDYAINTIYQLIQKEEFKNRKWDDAATAVDIMLNAITDSGEQNLYAAQYEFLKKIVEPHEDEHGFYRLQMGYGALFIERDPNMALTMFSKSIPIFISQQLYNEAAFAYRAEAIVYGATRNAEMAARNMVSASICNPWEFPENEWERKVRNLPNEKWIAKFIMNNPVISDVLQIAAKLAAENYAKMAVEAKGSCINTQTIATETPAQGLQ